MYKPYDDLRCSDGMAKLVAVCVCAVSLSGVVTVLVRAPGNGGRSAAQPGGQHWLLVTDRSVGFSARLPSRPTHDRIARPLANGSQVTISAARAKPRIVIERITLPVVSTAVQARDFRTAIDSLASGSGFQVRAERATRFRGQAAREGDYLTDDGTDYRVVIFVTNAGDLYLIASPAKYFSGITTSFRVLEPTGVR